MSDGINGLKSRFFKKEIIPLNFYF